MSSQPARSRIFDTLPAAFAVGFALLYFAGERFAIGETGYPLDDSYIHLQFARELAAGHGLSYNPGQLSTGSSSPLWTALLALGFLIPGFGMLWPKVLGTLCLVAAVLGTQRLLARLGADLFFQRAGGFLVATTPWLLWSALSGMEVLLFADLILWTMVFAVEGEIADPERPGLAAPLTAGLAALARPEGLLLAALVLACQAIRLQQPAAASDPLPPRLVLGRWGGVLRSALLIALLIVPLIAFQYYVGGSPWPSSMAAKNVPDDSILPNTGYLTVALGVFWDGGGILLLFAGAGALLLCQRAAQGLTNALLPFFFLFGLPAAYSLRASAAAPPPVGNFGRYLFPLLPLLVVLALLGLEQALKPYRAGVLLGRFRLPLRALALGLLVLLQTGQSVRGIQRYVQNVKNVADSDVAAARFLTAAKVPPDALIATQDIGAIKLLTPNPILDMVGIVTPEVIPLLRADDEVYWEERLYRLLEERRVDLVVAYPKSYPGLLGGRVGQLTPVISFKVDRNITMAGDELVVLRTPWCKFCQALPAQP